MHYVFIYFMTRALPCR